MSDPSLTTFSRRRKWNISLNLVIMLAAFMAILGMLNYLAARHYERISWTTRSQVELSDMTRQVLGTVTNEIKVTIFFDKQDTLYDPVADLLREYGFLNRGIRVELVDHQRQPGAAQQLKAQYELNPLIDKNVIIFESEGRLRVIQQKELSELDIQPLVSGQSREIKRTHFKGEMLFTSAIMNVTSQQPLKAYFLSGHREHDPHSNDAETGYSRMATLLRDNNIEWETLSLIGTNKMPDDCSLLVIAGPQNPMSVAELDEIEQYLEGGGRMLVLLNFYGLNRNSGLLYVLNKWNVQVGDNLVKDKDNTSNGQDIFIGNFSGHPISKPLVQTPLHMILPRSVEPVPPSLTSVNAPALSELIFTGPKARVFETVRKGVVDETSARAVVTNICLAVALEKGRIPDASADRGTTRVVVVGDSFFLNNQLIYSSANRDFASQAINWLMDRSEILGGLGPRPIQEYRLIVTTRQLTMLRWILLLAMPGVVLVTGLVVWVRRRR